MPFFAQYQIVQGNTAFSKVFLQEISQQSIYGVGSYEVALAAIRVYSDFHIPQVYEKPQMSSAAFHDFLMYSYTDYLLFGNT